MTSSLVTDQELRAKIVKSNTPSLQKEALNKGLKTEKELISIDKDTLIEIIFNHRKLVSSGMASSDAPWLSEMDK